MLHKLKKKHFSNSNLFIKYEKMFSFLNNSFMKKESTGKYINLNWKNVYYAIIMLMYNIHCSIFETERDRKILIKLITSLQKRHLCACTIVVGKSFYLPYSTNFSHLALHHNCLTCCCILVTIVINFSNYCLNLACVIVVFDNNTESFFFFCFIADVVT